MTNLRTKGKSIVVWILMGLLILGLAGFGVTSFNSGSSEIGTVGETEIDQQTYSRALTREMTSLSQQSGQALTMEQAQAIGLPRSVQAQLFTAAALEEEARRIGVSVGDNRVMQSIADSPAFQGPNGGFDRTSYSQILSREGLSEATFEQQVRGDEARIILHTAVTGGVAAPEAMTDRMADWLLQTRDISWSEVTEESLTTPVPDPDDETLKAWHSANADRFTAPEKRKISYVWLTPEMMLSEVQLDEQALKDAYQARIDQYQQPERRIVSRLVFPSQQDADSAKSRLEAGELSFNDLVAERGLTVDDIDLGEMTKAELGSAGEPVFALEQPGVIGPIETDLGPALYSMNAILDSVEISFEEAREELSGEASLDRAARMIEGRMDEFEDLLASGATLEDVAKETPMEMGTLDWSAEMDPVAQSIAGYPAFREAAGATEEGDFPHIERLDDGGIFALRLDEITPPALMPFAEVRERVAENWRAEELNRLLRARADEIRLTADDTGAAPQGSEAPQSTGTDDTANQANQGEPGEGSETGGLKWAQETGLARDGWIEGLPQALIAQAFAISEPGEIEIANADGRVFLVRLDKIADAEQTGEDSARVLEAVKRNLSQSLQNDIFSYYTSAIQSKSGITVNQPAIDAVHAQPR